MLVGKRKYKHTYKWSDRCFSRALVRVNSKLQGGKAHN